MTDYCEHCTGLQQFAVRVAGLAAGLRHLGMKAADRVALLSQDPDLYLEYLFAVPLANGKLSHCNTCWSFEEHSFALRDSHTTILLVDDEFSEIAGQLKRSVSSLRYVVHVGPSDTPAGMYNAQALIGEATLAGSIHLTSPAQILATASNWSRICTAEHCLNARSRRCA